MKSDMERLMTLVELMRKKQQAVFSMKEELAQLETELRSLERTDIPDLMTELGYKMIETTDGAVLTIKEEVEAKIAQANKPKAFKWLIKNGFGGLIKTEVNVAFPKGAHDEAVGLVEKLAKDFNDVGLKEDVHHSTLKSFVREQLSAGTAIPFDLFGIFPYNKAVIKEK